MGLDTSHNCWHGAYSAFMRWREKLAEVAELPPLRLMEGFYEPPSEEALEWARPRDGGPKCNSYHGPSLSHWIDDITPRLPIKWASLRPDPLYQLLHHSDCDGEIAAEDCAPIADSLERLLPLMHGGGGGHIGNYREKTEQFIKGLRLAAERNEPVDFH
jgi:hypothetical protein